jgi:hypothetical protein
MADISASPASISVVTRLEFYLVLILVLIGFGAFAWHEHNVTVAQEAVLAQREKEFKASSQQAQAQIEALQKQIADQQERMKAQEQLNQQLLATMQTLNTQLAALRTQEAQRIQQIQTMPVDQVAKAVAAELNQAGLSYNQTTQTLAGVTPDALRKIDVMGAELDSCKAESENILTQLDTATKLHANDALIQVSLQSTIQSLTKELELTKANDQGQINLLQQKLKVKTGGRLHRLWDKAKTPVCFVVGVALGHLI